MELNLIGRVNDVKPGDDVNFVTFTDTKEGGLVKVMMPNTIEVKLDQLVNLHCVVKPSIGKFGLNLRFVRNIEKP